MALSKHLIAIANPIANEENIVLWKDYRITVLQDRLFRIEKSVNHKFRDEATLSVWFRNMPKQDFFVRLSENEAIITTDCCKLIVKPSRAECRIEIDGELKTLTNKNNLFGTYSTLDVCDGAYYIDFAKSKKNKIKLNYGVCSKSGVAVINDINTLTLLPNGEVSSEVGEGSDEYVFAYGNDYRAAVKALYKITGKPPLIPRYAFGNWWSRYYCYTDKEYLKLLNRFEERNVPLTVATIDMDWHYSDSLDEEKHITEMGRNNEFYGYNNGWTGYSWNKKLFPDYKSFLKKVKSKNLKITLNLHPSVGIRWFEDCYTDMAKAMGKDPSTGERIKFDIADTDFINNYFSVIHKPYEKDGVDFWWIDWQQGTETAIKGLDPLWALNHYHFLDNALYHKPLILSRYAGVGSHRYPLGFSGDTIISWKTLKYLPYFTATSSNIGYTWWSHDIGGHMLGYMDEELYLRHIQFGVFSPINRLHCSNEVTTTKEPWVYGNGTGLIAMEWFRFRHRLIPFLYSCNYRTFNDGIALIEPLYYEWPNEKAAYEMKSEYIFGKDLLVAPVCTPLKKDGYSHTEVWIPEGVWTDIFTDDIYKVGKDGVKKTLLRKLESIPVLAKAGTIMPISDDEGNFAGNPQKLEVRVYNGNGEFSMFEDRYDTDSDERCFTDFSTEYFEEEKRAKQILTIKSRGDIAVIPQDRILKIVFKNVKDGIVSVYVDGVKVDSEEIISDYLTAKITYAPDKTYTIEAEFDAFDEVTYLKERAKSVLVGSEGKNEDKFWNCWEHLKNASNVEEFINIVECSKVEAVVKEKLLETIIR